MPDLVDAPLPAGVEEAWLGASPAARAGHLAPAVDLIVAALDDALGRFVDHVLHNEAFQRLESSWRGLAYLVRHVPFHENVAISVWSASKANLERDFAEATEIARTQTFFHVYSEQIGHFGGRPFAAILADMAFDATPRDTKLLGQMAAVAAMAHAPLFAAASPRLFQLSAPADLPRIADARVLFEGSTTPQWNSLRESEDARAAGLLVGRPLHRAPHASAESFAYTEETASTDDYLWGQPVYVFALRLATSFARYRTLSAIVGEADACPPPARVQFESLGPRAARPPLDVSVTPRLERALREVGIIPLLHRASLGGIFVASANSVQKPKAFGSADGGREATLNHLLGTKFPYFFFACRIVHYLKLIEREQIGETRTPETMEARLNAWLEQYVVNMDSASAEIRAQYPLRSAQARVIDIPEAPGWFNVKVALRPHLKYLNNALQLVVGARVRQ